MMMTVSRRSGFCLIFWQTSKPDILGIITSRRIRSGLKRSACAMASRPSTAVAICTGSDSR